MKKIIGLLTLLALLAIPVSAMAVKAGDWELVGYTKLEAWWDSAQINKNLSGPMLRGNSAIPQQIGKFRMTAQSSRFGLKVNGPEVLGAKTQGYIEIDFDPTQDARQSASNSWTPRMRHAWFRMDWPGGWQLLMGQYWGVFCDFYPETVNDGPLQNHGMATQRIPQARLTYKTGPWTFSGLVGVPYDPSGDNVTSQVNNLSGGGVVVFPGSQSASAANGALWGQFSAFPQFQGQVIFEQDLYGKAAFAGRPRGFVADFGAGVQHLTYLPGQIVGGSTFGQNGFQGIGNRALVTKDTQTLTPWVVQGTLFIPVLVTHNNNLAGTASLTLQAHIGQGFSFFGDGADSDNSFFKYDAPATLSTVTGGFVEALSYKRYLTPKYGGYLQAQYYITNEWYVSAVYGFDKAYGLTRDTNGFLVSANNPAGYTYATLIDQSQMTQEIQATLFFTPSKNLKFGLGYSYLRSTWPQITQSANATSTAALAGTSKITRFGENHSIRFGGWFFF
jgi:hypothetical protein